MIYPLYRTAASAIGRQLSAPDRNNAALQHC
jgi:hypothetical protein